MAKFSPTIINEVVSSDLKLILVFKFALQSTNILLNGLHTTVGTFCLAMVMIAQMSKQLVKNHKMIGTLGNIAN
jgi:hypothetical protein